VHTVSIIFFWSYDYLLLELRLSSFGVTIIFFCSYDYLLLQLRLSSLYFRRLFSCKRDHIWYQEHTHTTQSYRSTLWLSNSWQQHVRMEKLAENDLPYFYLCHAVIAVTTVTTISLTPVKKPGWTQVLAKGNRENILRIPQTLICDTRLWH
jgi:hypothetical protein